MMQCVEVGRRLRADHLDRARREVALHDEHLRAGVGELVAEELALVRGVDRHLRPRRACSAAKKRHDLLGPVVEQRRDAVAVAEPERRQRVREPRRLRVHLARGVLDVAAVGLGEVEVRPVGIGGETLRERVEHGGLRSLRVCHEP